MRRVDVARDADKVCCGLLLACYQNVSRISELERETNIMKNVQISDCIVNDNEYSFYAFHWFQLLTLVLRSTMRFIIEVAGEIG